MTTRLTQLRPMLAVSDLHATIEFFTTKLGFTLTGTFGDPPVWAEVVRDDIAIMFNAPPSEDVKKDVPRRSRDYSIYYINTPDVADLRDEFLSRGVEVSDLRVTIYGMKEFELRAPDGIWFWFGHPSDEEPTVRE